MKSKCQGCKHEDKEFSQYPCNACRRNYKDRYKAKKEKYESQDFVNFNEEK